MFCLFVASSLSGSPEYYVIDFVVTVVVAVLAFVLHFVKLLVAEAMVTIL